jgi:hypothetical protein
MKYKTVTKIIDVLPFAVLTGLIILFYFIDEQLAALITAAILIFTLMTYFQIIGFSLFDVSNNNFSFELSFFSILSDPYEYKQRSLLYLRINKYNYTYNIFFFEFYNERKVSERSRKKI